MKIGKLIQRLECPDVEKIRIRMSITEGVGLPSQIFGKYVSKIDDDKVWRVANNAHGIKGFRQNKYNPFVIDKIKENIGKGLYKHDSIFWNLYGNCVVAWLKKEKSKLNNFFLSHTHEEDKNDSEHLIKSIAENRIAYDFSKIDILDFYDAYWFKRIENIEELIRHHEINETSITFLAKRLFDACSYSLHDDIKNNNKLTSDLTNKLNALDDDFRNKFYSARNDELLEKLSLEVKALTDSASQYEAHISHIIARNDAVKNEVVSIAKRIEKIDSTKEYAKGLTTLSSSVESHSAQLADLDDRINALQDLLNKTNLDVSGGPQKNIDKKAKDSVKKNLVNDEATLATLFSLYLDNNYGISLDHTQAIIYHTIFLESPIVFIENYALFETWINAIGWKDGVMNFVASPSWISESDWSDGVNFLLDNNSEIRIVVIHNFDVALVRAYLMPVLHKLSLRNTSNTAMSKIVLVSSEPNILLEYQDLLQYGSSINHEDYRRLDVGLRRFGTFINGSRPNNKSDASFFVPLKTLMSWKSEGYLQERLDSIWRASGINFPSIQKNLSAILNESLGKKISKEEALLASIYHTSRGWVEAKHGPNEADDFFELVRLEAGSKVSY